MSDGSPIYFSGATGASPPIPAQDVLNYIADILDEFEDMAKRHQRRELAYLLQQSAAEARRQALGDPSI